MFQVVVISVLLGFASFQVDCTLPPDNKGQINVNVATVKKTVEDVPSDTTDSFPEPLPHRNNSTPSPPPKTTPTPPNSTTTNVPTPPITPNVTSTIIPTLPTSTKPPPPPSTSSPTKPSTTTTPVPPTPSTTPLPGPSNGTTTVSPVTTAVPPTPVPDRKFDAFSFLGGFALGLGLVAIGFLSYKFYLSRQENYYHTL